MNRRDFIKSLGACAVLPSVALAVIAKQETEYELHRRLHQQAIDNITLRSKRPTMWRIKGKTEAERMASYEMGSSLGFNHFTESYNGKEWS